MYTISYRLAEVRKRVDLSIRAFAEVLEERTGFRVAHDSVRRYESGETRVPATYLREVCRAFDLSADWLLLGKGQPTRQSTSLVHEAFEQISAIVGQVRGWEEGMEGGTALRLVQSEWERFIQGLPPKHRLREAIIDSWQRSKKAGVEPELSQAPRRVSTRDLRRRQTAHRKLIQAAAPYLEWLSAATGDLPHVAVLTCKDGIVLDGVAADPELLDRWSLTPGCDSSEAARGTNGAGTALALGKVIAVLGPEHYARLAHGSTCHAAPIRDAEGEIVGAIDLGTIFGGWRPDRLVFVAYAVEMIERDLAAAEKQGR